MLLKRASGGAHFLKALKTTPEWVRETAREVADEFLGLVHEGFDKSRSPTGKRWAPLVLRRGKPLRLSGSLQRSFAVDARIGKSAGAITFRIASADERAEWHQGGTGLYGPKRSRIYPVKKKALHIPGHGLFASVKGSPKREMVPTNGLPVRWQRKYERVFSDAFKEHFE